MLPIHIQRVCIGYQNQIENCADSFDGSVKARGSTMRWEKRKAESIYEMQHDARRNGVNQAGIITCAKCGGKFSWHEYNDNYPGAKDREDACSPKTEHLLGIIYC